MQPSATTNPTSDSHISIGQDDHTVTNQEAGPSSGQQVGPSCIEQVAAHAAAQPCRQSNSPADGDVNQRTRREPDANGSYRQAGHRRKPARQNQPAAAVDPRQAEPPQAAEPEALGRGRRTKIMTAVAMESAEQADLGKDLLASRRSTHQQASAAEPTGRPTGSKWRQREGEQQLPQPKKGRFAAGIPEASSSGQADVPGTAQLQARFPVPAATGNQALRVGEASGHHDSPAVVLNNVDAAKPARTKKAASCKATKQPVGQTT